MRRLLAVACCVAGPLAAGGAAAGDAARDAAGETCPAILMEELRAEVPICDLLASGELRSRGGNDGVTYRLYRWGPAYGDTPSALFDSAPYNQTAVTLAPAGDADAAPFWARAYWQGEAWFETPTLKLNPEFGEFLVVPGRYTGTGSFTEDFVFMPDEAGGWAQIHAQPFEPETGEGWLAGLTAYLPPEHGIWKGLRVDYATLTGTTAVWREGDANCCPSGGELWFRLRLDGPERRLVVAKAHHRPAE